MKCPIHREGWVFTAGFAVCAFVFSRFSRVLGWFFAFFAVFTAFFFRDPEREIPQGDGLILSPADGTILGIEKVDDVHGLEGPQQKISIFLSIFNVHINRAPIEGKVTFRRYSPGKFFPANFDKASEENERNSLIIDDAGYKVMVKQIAGIIARRIVCWVDPGMVLARGERFGLIRFGSRTELFLPMSAKVHIKPGDKIKAGETIIGKRT